MSAATCVANPAIRAAWPPRSNPYLGEDGWIFAPGRLPIFFVIIFPELLGLFFSSDKITLVVRFFSQLFYNRNVEDRDNCSFAVTRHILLASWLIQLRARDVRQGKKRRRLSK